MIQAWSLLVQVLVSRSLYGMVWEIYWAPQKDFLRILDGILIVVLFLLDCLPKIKYLWKIWPVSIIAYFQKVKPNFVKIEKPSDKVEHWHPVALMLNIHHQIFKTHHDSTIECLKEINLDCIQLHNTAISCLVAQLRNTWPLISQHFRTNDMDLVGKSIEFDSKFCNKTNFNKIYGPTFDFGSGKPKLPPP